MDRIKWTHAEMIEETCAWWDKPDISADDCDVVESTDLDDEPCLIVIHKPTGKTSTEAADGGRWHLDGTAY